LYRFPRFPRTGIIRPLTVPLSWAIPTRWMRPPHDRLVAAWGAGTDGYFACPIPHHQGRSLLIPDGAGSWRLGCCAGRERSLAEVCAALAYGADGLRSNIELAMWWRRLGWELGALAPVSVAVPDLPDGAPPAAGVARDGFVLLLGLRQSDRAPRPAAYSVRFAAAWSGLGKSRAAEAIRFLRDAGVIREAGRMGRVPVYDPGASGAARIVRGRAP
jgi:hypothetical protein